MKTKIAIASDDVGFARKEEIKKYLIEEKNMEIVYDPVTCKEQGVNNFALWPTKWQALFNAMSAVWEFTFVGLALALLVRSTNTGA